MRTSIDPKYACPCLHKSAQHNNPHQPTRDQLGVFENMISECISHTKATLSLIPGYEYAGTLASDDGRGLSARIVWRFLGKLFSSADREDEVVVWYIGHGSGSGTGDWYVGDAINPIDNINHVTRTCILELYQRFFAGRRLTIVSDSCYAGALTRLDTSPLPKNVFFGPKPVFYSPRTYRGRLTIVAGCGPHEMLPLKKVTYDKFHKALKQSSRGLQLSFSDILESSYFTNPLQLWNPNGGFVVQQGLHPEVAYFWAKLP